MLTIAKVPLDILKRPFCWAISIEHCVPLWDKTRRGLSVGRFLLNIVYLYGIRPAILKIFTNGTKEEGI
jgi:hypothetical protein